MHNLTAETGASWHTKKKRHKDSQETSKREGVSQRRKKESKTDVLQRETTNVFSCFGEKRTKVDV